MATLNNDNSNFVSLLNVPKIQSISDGIFLILSTAAGARLIDWANVNVPNLTPTGGVSFTDTVTATNINSQSALIQTLCANNIIVNNIPSITQGLGYYNRFTFTNGVATSADYVNGSPEYNSLVSIIASTSSYLTRVQPNVYCAYATILIPNGSRYANVLGFGTDPTVATPYNVPVNITSFNKSDFNIAYLSNQGFSLSALPVMNGYYITAIQQLSAQIDLGQYNTSGLTLSAELKVLKYY